MQDLINLSLGEMQRDEHQDQAAQINRDAWQWQHPQQRPRWDAIVKALIAFATAPAQSTPLVPPAAR